MEEPSQIKDATHQTDIYRRWDDAEGRISHLHQPHQPPFGKAYRPSKDSTDSKNLLKHRLTQRRELPETDKNIMEAPNRPLRTNILGQGPTSHVILLLNVKVASS
jgi:hypothetical protein